MSTEQNHVQRPALIRFRRLVNVAAAATFLLVVVGGIVRVSDSGLGCGPAGSGLRGWPLCGGGLAPGTRTHPIIEYTHRMLAAIVVVLIAAIVWQALRHLREHRLLVRGALLAGVLVVVQAVIGGLTVEHGLETALVAIHLGVAMALLALLIACSAATRPRRAAPPGTRRLRVLAIVTCVSLFSTIVAGGVIAGTERQGTSGVHLAGAHLACGTEFPQCNGEWLPFGRYEMLDIQLTHRTLMALTVLASLALLSLAWRRRIGGPLLAPAIGLALAGQVLLGAMNVWRGKQPSLIVGHLALATLLWILLVSLTLRLIGVGIRERAAASEPAPLPAAAG